MRGLTGPATGSIIGIRWRFPFLLLVAVLSAFTGCAGNEPRRAQFPGDNKPNEGYAKVGGGTYMLPGAGECKAVVLLFWGHDCPISNAYAPEITRLWREYSPKGVSFCVVYADAKLTAEEADKHKNEFGYPCIAILDPKMSLALRVGATVTPEAAVLSAKGERLYLGAIDDIYAGFGKRRSQPSCRYLKDALDAALAGTRVPVARTHATGCYIALPQRNY
jgi:hypothetical protein